MRCQRLRLFWNIGAYHSRYAQHISHYATLVAVFALRILPDESFPIASASAPLSPAVTLVVAACSSNGGSGGSSEEAWRDVNQRVIDQHKVGGREREVPAVTVPMTLAAGVPVERSALATVTIAPGVSATLGWGRGALLERVEMQPGAAYPSQTLNEELIIVVQDGSATIDVGGKAMELSKDQVLYLQPGSVRSMKAGSNGWKAFEVYSPVRLDHLALAGQNVSGVSPSFPDQGVTPSLPPGVVVNVNEIQLTPLVDPLAGKTYKRSTGLSRLIWGRNAQISLIRMDPGSEIALHRHPEDQLTHTIRGSLDQGVMDKTFPASGTAGHMLFLPGGMVHSAKLGETGADQLDVVLAGAPGLRRARAQTAGAVRAGCRS